MSAEKRNLFSLKLPRGTPAHATVMLAAGGYVIYMAYQMIRNTLSGQSTMSLPTTYVLSGLMALVGLGVIGYGLAMWVAYVKTAKEAESTKDDEA